MIELEMPANINRKVSWARRLRLRLIVLAGLVYTAFLILPTMCHMLGVNF